MPKKFGYFLHRKSTKIVIAFTIVLLIIYPFLFKTKKSFADEISLYPTKCVGSWNNADEASGDPADNLLIGAESTAVGETLTCYSFDTTSLPEDASITDTHLEFLWTVVDDKNNFIEPSIEESYDQITPLTEEKIIDQGTEIQTLDTEITPLIEQNDLKVLPEADNIEPVINDSKVEPGPTSRLPFSIRSLFISEVSAEEQLVAPVETPLETVETNNETKTDLQNEQNIDIQTEQKDLQAQENISIEEASSENEMPLNDSILNDTSSIQTDTNDEGNAEATKEIVNEVDTGTALYSISYAISDNKQQSLGQVTQEQLSKIYPISLTVDDLSFLKVSLTSLMTFDQIDNLALEGIKLVVEYSTGDSLDPIRQPDLYTDKILDRITLDGIEAIRIERADNKKYEIWYRTIDPQQSSEINQNNTEAIVIKEDTQIPVVTESSLLETPSLTSEELIGRDKAISETEKLIIENPDTESTSLPTETVSPDISLEKKTSKTPEKKKRFYWNFIDGDDSVHRAMPIALQDGYVFWLNKKGTVLSSYNILTQGYNSQIYEPESGDNFIMYRSPSSQEKKAILILSEKKFVFTE
jgi:hypothetical protein